MVTAPANAAPGKATGRCPWLPRTAKLAVSLGLLAWLLSRIDADTLWHATRSVDPWYYLLALIATVLNLLLLAGKYAVLMRPVGLGLPFAFLVRVNFVCRFYALLLPGAVGDGLLRWYQLNRRRPEGLRYLGVMALERVSFLGVLLVAVLAGGWLNLPPRAEVLFERILPVLLTGIVTVAGGTVWVLSGTRPPGAASMRNDHGPAGWRRHLHALANGLGQYRRRRATLLKTLSLAIVWQACFGARVYLLALSAGLSLAAAQIMWVGSVVLLVQALPISMGGLGLREGAYVLLLGCWGLPPEKGLLLGLLLFSQIVVTALAGAVMQALPHPPAEGDSAPEGCSNG